MENTAKAPKTTVFNLIILDESGSMSSIAKQTVTGCNETLNVIRSLQKKHGDTQRNLVSIYLFQESAEVPSRYVYKNKPIAEVEDMTEKVYRPYGCTPLLDAVGSTLVDLKAVASTHEDATGTVTIITDGMENASLDYSVEQVVALISQMKEMGWTFNFIGANIDVDMMAKKLHIDNAMAFKADSQGTSDMWETYTDSLQAHEEKRIIRESCVCASPEQRKAMRVKHSKDFFI